MLILGLGVIYFAAIFVSNLVTVLMFVVSPSAELSDYATHSPLNLRFYATL